MPTSAGKRSTAPEARGKTGCSQQHEERVTQMNKGFRGILPLIFIAVLTSLLFAAVLAFQPDKQASGTDSITEWQIDDETVDLPLTVKQLPPRSSLTLTTEIQPKKGDYLYLKTVYAPLRLYANETLIFEYGQQGSYPGFLIDPPTRVALVPLPDTADSVTLRMEYLSPAQRNSIVLHPVLLGSREAILWELIGQMGFSLFFSFVLLALGILLFLTAFVLTRFETEGSAFFWLGLFCVCVGCWVSGECNLTGLLIDAPVFLYLLAFLGLFTMAVPILKFGYRTLGLQRESRRLLNGLTAVLEICINAAIILQLTGSVAFSKSMYLFHVVVPLSLCVFAAVLLRESAQYQNRMARKFLIPTAVLAVFSLLEVCNYYLLHLPVQKSFFFQIGVFVFVVIIGVIGGYFLRDAFLLRAQNGIMQQQIKIQREQYQLLLETEENRKRLRHSVKHHLAAIRILLVNHEQEAALADLNAMLDKLSEDVTGRLCSNSLVNATAMHYQAMARQAGATADIRLDIPEDTGSIPDSELCVIIGDMLENAVAACRGAENPFLKMRSRCADGILTITLDNSYSFIRQNADGSFQSTRDGGGLGLKVITALAEKHGGGSRFEAKDGVFYSSVYMQMA